MLCAGIMSKTLLLLQAPQKRLLGLWPFCILSSIICPNCTGTQLFLVLSSFFVSIARGDVCPGASPAAKGPRSQVPGPNLSHSGESERKASVSDEERSRGGGRHVLADKKETESPTPSPGTMSSDTEAGA